MASAKETNKKTVKPANAGKTSAKKTPAEPVSAEVFISKDDMYLFGQGTHYDIYKKLGAHPSVKDGKKGYYFAITFRPPMMLIPFLGLFSRWPVRL